MSKRGGKVAILVGGGPAPGINSVIAAATIRAILKGYDVLGIHGGFRWLMKGKTTEVTRLTIPVVSLIHFRGGSLLGSARDNPTGDKQLLDNTVRSLLDLGVDKLITIGGDDTAYSAMTVEKHAQGKIRVVHVPKTIDNDLDLPHGAYTFGFQTARHAGVDLAKNLMIDARTTGRWYFIISMGRKAGHLALGIGKAASTPVTIIPEEFASPQIRLRTLVDILAGAMIKRLAENRADGIAIIAEGVLERLDPNDFHALKNVEYDEHGHIRLGEIQFGPVLKEKVMERLAEFGIKEKITTKDIGYELRCAAPIPYDMEYTRDLGYCAAQFIINGGTGAMVVIDERRFQPIYFKDMLDEHTGKTRVRMVNIESEYYHIARRYMLRLSSEDFEDKRKLREYAKIAGVSPERFREEFGHILEEDLLERIHREKRGKETPVDDVMTP